MTCNYYGKPSYSTFWNDYSSYISQAASGTNVPQSAIASQWYDEWGIPINNPANQTSSFGYCYGSTCGSFPYFCSLSDGVNAYIDQVNYSYNGGSNAWTDIFGQQVNWSGAYQNGYPGGLSKTSVETDGGCYVTANSVHYYGLGDTPNPPSSGQLAYYREQGAQASMEAMGASPWDAGHYMNCGESEPGIKLINIASNSGWLSSYSYV
ncbi:hypothetical protein [Sulfoacidibacillus thermotolerans]|uniref:Uncharacterized protein n=1 Tax=Sulfoacidibacillus thermotolerans TaxID=1765684 RepID=A0A2U3CVK1_SULT2|nr:hypothetical protein [Sulfoacidibacillus thermotolerans]PWI53047.1 hypothetical protein BM613_14010 [Sulfoacidibacillus thermotolerans]